VFTEYRLKSTVTLAQIYVTDLITVSREIDYIYTDYLKSTRKMVMIL